MKHCSKKLCGHGMSVNKRSKDCSLHIVSDFLLYGFMDNLVRREKT